MNYKRSVCPNVFVCLEVVVQKVKLLLEHMGCSPQTTGAFGGMDSLVVEILRMADVVLRLEDLKVFQVVIAGDDVDQYAVDKRALTKGCLGKFVSKKEFDFVQTSVLSLNVMTVIVGVEDTGNFVLVFHLLVSAVKVDHTNSEASLDVAVELAVEQYGETNHFAEQRQGMDGVEQDFEV